MSGDYLTIGEFDRFRADLGGRLDRLEEKIDTGFLNLNGRTRNQAEAIVALDAKILHISSRGCARYDEHREAINTMLGSGEGLSKTKQAGIAAGAGAGLIGLIEIAKLAAAHFWK